MKRQEKNKLQTLKKEELISRLKKQRQEAMKIKLQKEAGKIKDVHAYMKKRKEIATILTILKQKELEEKAVNKGD